MKTLKLEVPDEVVKITGSVGAATKEAKEALVLDLVRRGRISRAKAAELLELDLWDLPRLLAKYKLPWFDYTEEELQADLKKLRSHPKR
jgi:predicted HTH domain antitoxin